MELLSVLGSRAARADMQAQDASKRNDSEPFKVGQLVLVSYGGVRKGLKPHRSRVCFMAYARLPVLDTLDTNYYQVQFYVQGS